MEDAVVKLIVIGDSLVGKTSLIHRYVNQTFRYEYKSTIGVDFSLKHITWNNLVNVKLQLWDIAGQERFTFMTRAYYKDAKGCLLLFDLTNSCSFQKVKRWKNDLDSKVRKTDGSLIPCLLVGNKSDLSEREVSKEEISRLCQDLNFVGWTETSAKEGEMINESVSYLLDTIMGKPNDQNSINDRRDFLDSVRLEDQQLTKKKKGEPKCQC